MKKEISKLKKENDKIWSLIIRKKANFTCEMCGTQTNKLEAHHIFSRRHILLRWDTRNGIGLCYYCHLQRAHREPVEFAEWIKEKIGTRLYNKLKKLSRQEAHLSDDDIRKWNEKLRKEFKQVWGVSYEEYKKRKRR